jgi:hypothetical protein
MLVAEEGSKKDTLLETILLKIILCEMCRKEIQNIKYIIKEYWPGIIMYFHEMCISGKEDIIDQLAKNCDLALDECYSDRSKKCPKCGIVFMSKTNYCDCPNCKNSFYASKPWEHFKQYFIKKCGYCSETINDDEYIHIFSKPDAVGNYHRECYLKKEMYDQYICAKITYLDKLWKNRERTCPKCQNTFVSVNNKGQCLNCGNVFYASEPTINKNDYINIIREEIRNKVDDELKNKLDKSGKETRSQEP